MKNITIGPLQRDWRVAATARYYAERGKGEDYAFGSTPADALAKLEQREAIRALKFDENQAEDIAFLAIGAANFLRTNQGVDLDWCDGYLGFIGLVVRHAPMLERRWRQMEAGSFGGVWPYDVTERFGYEWAEALLQGDDEPPEVLLESIIADEMERWN